MSRLGREGFVERFAAACAALPFEVLRAVLLLVAFGSATMALLAQAGRFNALFDILAHVAFIGLWVSGAAFILAIAFAGKQGRSSAVLGAAGVVLWASLVAPDYIAALTARRAPAGGEMLKVMQFNVWGSNPDLKGTIQGILAEDADVVVLEEVSDQASAIVPAVHERYPFRTGCDGPYPCSTVILTKSAPIAAGGYAPPRGKANLAWVTLQGAGGTFTVVGVHHSWPDPMGDQAEQTVWTAGVLKSFDRGSLILAGDFNSTPWSAALRKQDKRFELERRDRALRTYPARLFEHRPFAFPVPLLPIDHIYAGQTWKTVSVGLGPRLGSDHYPVIAVLRRDSSVSIPSR